jgi:hypothetical protein
MMYDGEVLGQFKSPLALNQGEIFKSGHCRAEAQRDEGVLGLMSDFSVLFLYLYMSVASVCLTKHGDNLTFTIAAYAAVP